MFRRLEGGMVADRAINHFNITCRDDQSLICIVSVALVINTFGNSVFNGLCFCSVDTGGLGDGAKSN